MLKVFNYKCLDCKHIFEKFVSTHSLPQECPMCGSTKTNKTVTSSAFKLTGQGQYTTKMKV